MLELNKLYNMDCMQGMKEFPDGFFDLAIVDPPYGIGIDGQKKRVCGNPKHNRKEHIRKSWDKAIPPPEYFRELERVSKAQVIWGGNYFVPYLEQGHKGWLVWDKGQHGLTMSDCELAYTSFDTPTRVFVCNRVELLNDGTIHPTQKPVKLYSWVLSLFARKGMKILDTHAGSGSSLIACYRQGGLDFVGFEIDEDYCRAANERLEQEQAQIRLFDLLEAEGFTWEAYMRMSGAMLAECAEVCFLPDWKESKGAKYEFGEAMAQNKPFFFFADWEKAQEETNKYEYTTEKTDKIAFQCFVCGKFNVFPATRADGNTCKYCGGGLKALGYAKKTEGSRNAGE